MPLNISLPTTFADGAAGHTAAHNATNTAVNSIGAAVDSLSGSGGGSSTAVTHNTQTGTAYTLALTDAGKVVERSNAAANTTTVPSNSSVAFPVGTFLSVRQYGAGQSSIAASAGVTIRSYGGGFRLAGQYAEATLTKRATDEWVLSGETAV